MTLLYFDGFETYDPAATSSGGGALDEIRDVYMHGDDNDLTGATISIESSDRDPGEQKIQINSSASSGDLGIVRTLKLPLAGLSSEDDWTFGAAFRVDGGLNGASEYTTLFMLSDNAGRMLDLRLRGNGDIMLQRTRTPLASITLDTAVGVWDADFWNYIELYVKFHGSTGEYEVRRDGATLFSGTGANTSNTGGTRPLVLDFGHVQSKNWQIDDLYVLDDQGTINNTFLNPDVTRGGNVLVQRVIPNATGDSATFTPSAAVDNYTLVDEDAEDDDTTYVESRTATNKDLYNYEDILVGTMPIIHGVMAKPVLRKTDGGSRTYKLLAKSSGTEVDSGTRYPSVSYVRQTYIWPTDPDTTLPWTVEGFNAAQFGLEVVA